MLIGRHREQRVVGDLLTGAKAGTSGVVVLVGEAGIGKTALLDFASASAAEFLTLRSRAVESESELPFGALSQLCRPILGQIDHLDARHRTALRGALGLSATPVHTGSAVGAAVLALLASAAEQRPLLLLVDDTHWLDPGSAEALAFALRRLRMDAVACLLATRPQAEGQSLVAGFDDLQVGPLEPGDAEVLLQNSAPAESDAAARQSMLEVAGGNPLALLELPRHAPAVPRIHGTPLPIGERLEREFAGRAAELSPSAQQALLTAAASGSEDVAIVGAALHRLGLDISDLEAAEPSGLVVLEGGTVRFRHPLVRSATYHRATPAERRDAHRSLGESDPHVERAAWHLAAAAVQADDQAAHALENAAEAARARSDFAMSAKAYQRAAQLSREHAERLRLLTAAADTAWLGGDTTRALELIEEALLGRPDAPRRGELLHTRGTIEHFIGEARRAHLTLEGAADLLVDTDSRRAALSLTEAVGSALFTGETDRAVMLGERAIVLAGTGSHAQVVFASVPRGASLLLAGRATEAGPILREAAAAARNDELDADPRNLTWAALAGWWVGDGELMSRRGGQALDWARDAVAPAAMPWAAALAGLGDIMTGRWRDARVVLQQGVEAGRLTSQHGHLAMTLSFTALLDAAQGRRDQCRATVAEGEAITDALGLRWIGNWLLRSLAVLDLGDAGRGGWDGVVRLWRSLQEAPLREPLTSSSWGDLIEGLIHMGEADAAREYLEQFSREAADFGEPLPSAIAHRCHGLLAEGERTVEHLEDSLDFLARTTHPFETARTRLCLGRARRHQGERLDARQHLHEAAATFARLGAVPWEDQANAELRATGERRAHRARDGSNQLTPQELQIALAVADGCTNRDVATRTFLSPRTVEWHLSSIYRKLGVTSRTAMVRALAEQSTQP